MMKKFDYTTQQYTVTRSMHGNRFRSLEYGRLERKCISEKIQFVMTSRGLD